MLNLLVLNTKTGCNQITEVDFDLPLYEVGEYVSFIFNNEQAEGTITSLSLNRIKIDEIFYNQVKYMIDDELEINEEQIEYIIDSSTLVEEE